MDTNSIIIRKDGILQKNIEVITKEKEEEVSYSTPSLVINNLKISGQTE